MTMTMKTQSGVGWKESGIITWKVKKFYKSVGITPNQLLPWKDTLLDPSNIPSLTASFIQAGWTPYQCDIFSKSLLSRSGQITFPRLDFRKFVNTACTWSQLFSNQDAILLMMAGKTLEETKQYYESGGTWYRDSIRMLAVLTDQFYQPERPYFFGSIIWEADEGPYQKTAWLETKKPLYRLL